ICINFVLMNRNKRPYLKIFSALLLLSFSMVFFPLDVFHNHQTVVKYPQQKNEFSTGAHDFNLKANSDYCWVCSVHFDKTFITPTADDEVSIPFISTVFYENGLLEAIAERIFVSLRGPPVQ